MQTSTAAPATTVDGEIFRESKSRAVTFLIIGLALILVSATFALLTFPSGGAIGGLVVGLFFSVPMVASTTMTLLTSPRFLVGKDRLQYLKGGSRVRGQVPFDNIAAIKLIRTKTRKLETIGLKFKNPKRADTFWGGTSLDNDEATQEAQYEHGCDIEFGLGLERPVQDLYQMILARCHAVGDGQMPAG